MAERKETPDVLGELLAGAPPPAPRHRACTLEIPLYGRGEVKVRKTDNRGDAGTNVVQAQAGRAASMGVSADRLL